jgi:hypothetical protein
VGKVIVSTREPHGAVMLDVIRELGLEVQVVSYRAAGPLLLRRDQTVDIRIAMTPANTASAAVIIQSGFVAVGRIVVACARAAATAAFLRDVS